MRRALLPLAAATVAAIAAWGLSAPQLLASPETVLRCGYMELPPYLHDTPKGPQGFVADVLNNAATIAGVRLQWVRSVDADADLKAHKIDLFPILSITRERQQAFHFSNAWWENSLVLLSYAKQKIATVSETAGRRVLVRDRAITVQTAREIFPRATVVPRPLPSDVFRAFCAREADAVFIDQRLAQNFLLENRGCGEGALVMSPVPEARFELGTVSTREQARPANLIFKAITRMAVDGSLNRLAGQYSIFSALSSEYVRQSIKNQHAAWMFQFLWSGVLLVFALLVLDYIRVRRGRASISSAWKAAEEARADLEESQRLFQAFMKHSPAIAHIKDAEGRMTYLNEAGARFVGKEPKELIGKTDAERWPQPYAETVRKQDLQVLSTRRQIQFSDRVPNLLGQNQGEERELLVLKFPIPSRTGDCSVGTVCLDVTEQRKSERFLHLSRFSIERSPDVVLWVDHRGRMFYANSTAARISGHDDEFLKSQPISTILQGPVFGNWPQTWDKLHETGSFLAEVNLVTSRGGSIPGELSLHLVPEGEMEFACAIWRDITERKQTQQELYFQAFHDQLTGLANRRLFFRNLEQAMAATRADGSSIALIFIDVDDFKLVNDHFGHRAGDEVLIFAGRAIVDLLPENATVGRAGGDEFTILLPRTTAEQAERIAGALAASLRRGLLLPSTAAVSLTCSIGIATYPEHAETAEEIYHGADLALYEAKRGGKNRCVIYSKSIYQASRQRVELEHALVRALEREEFELYYQPQFRVRDHKLVRYEALIRWHWPEKGLTMPDQFITAAEESGLIIPIGKWVFEAACKQLLAWRGTALEGIPVAVNVSAVQFGHPDLVLHILQTLDRYHAPAHLLELEITESVLMSRIDDAARKIQELRNYGIVVSIDDFGSGYSSLSYLRELPIDALKIDRCFVRALETDGKAMAMVDSMVSLARSLGLRTVVEGVEREEQLNLLLELGCDDAQGYLLGRPRSAAQIERAGDLIAGLVQKN